MKSSGVIAKSVKQLEKELYKSSSLFEEVNHLTKSLQEIERQARVLEELTENDPKLGELFKKEIKDTEVIRQFKQVQSNLLNLRHELRKHEEPSFRADIFLENYRTQNNYLFPSEELAIGFIGKVLKDSRAKEFFFGPRLLGLIDLNMLAEKLNLKKVSPHYLKVPSAKLPALTRYLKGNVKPVECLIECRETRIQFYNDFRCLTVKSTPEKVKHFDRLGKLFDAQTKF